MGAAIADARFGSDDRLLIGCAVGSLLLHALVVLYVPRVLPHGEPLRPMTATIREAAPPPVLPKGEPPPVITPQPEVAKPREIAPPAKPVERKADPLPPAKSEAPVRQEILTAPPQAAAAAERAPSVPAPAQTPAGTAAAPASAVPAARPEIRRDADPPKSAGLAEPPGVPDGSITCRYANDLVTLINIRRLLRYPQEARENGWTGKSVVIVMIGVDGKIAGVKTATSSGYDIIDEQARIAAARAKPFVAIPSQLVGKAFEVRLSIGFDPEENPGGDSARTRLSSC